MKRDCACPRARHQHGTRGAYQYDGCRCFTCRIAYSRIHEAYRNGATWRDGSASLIGTMRRLQALHAAGWPFESLAERLGTSRQALSQLANGKRKGTTVFQFTADRVAALYEEIWDHPPAGTAALRARLNAQRKGWLPPMAWDDNLIDDPDYTPQNCRSIQAVTHRRRDSIDPIRVQEAIAGRRTRLTTAEMTAAVATMTGAGYSIALIAQRLYTTERTVQRHRAKQQRAEETAA